jgi:hypothetical protein
MRTLNRLLPVALLVLLLAAPGCTLRGPEKIRRQISQSTGTEYSREIGITLGRVGLAVARMALDEEDEELKVLEHLTKIRVGVYQVESRPETPGQMELGRLAMADWEPMVDMRQGEEDVLVLLKRKKGEVREMLVVVNESDELVIVRMKGRLDRVLEEAAAFGKQEARQKAERT